MTDPTEIFAASALGGVVWTYLFAWASLSRGVLMVALTLTVLMVAHFARASAHDHAERRLNSYPVMEDVAPKRESWKHHLSLAMIQKDGRCLTTTITHAAYLGREASTDNAPEVMEDHLWNIIPKNVNGCPVDIGGALYCAKKVGYIRHFYRLETFDEYKEVIGTHAVLIGHEMSEGMLDTSEVGGGFIGPTTPPLLDKAGKVRMHVALLLGRDPHWFTGRYSTYKSTGGPSWGERFSEAKITDKELKLLFDTSGFEAWAVVGK